MGRDDLTYQEELLVELIEHVAVIRRYTAFLTAVAILGVAGALIAMALTLNG